jgi:hypothetical protein
MSGSKFNIIEIKIIRNPEKNQKPGKIRKNFQKPEFFRKIRKIWQP